MRGIRFQFNVAAIILQVLAVILLSIALFLPEWLANPAGLSYYPYSRSWGLLTVNGRQVNSHSTQWSTMCSIAGQMSLGMACVTPLCNWYTQKCGAYRIVLIVSWIIFGAICLVCLLALASGIVSLRKTARATQFATATAFCATGLIVAAMVTYVFGMGNAFSIINSAGYYPVPQPSVSFILACVATFLLFLAAIVHTVRWRRLRREELFVEEAEYEHMKFREDLGI